MTEIRAIHGHEEMAQRGRQYSQNMPRFIPYLSMTAGEVRLALLEQQAEVFAAAYPENKEYKKAANMLRSALRGGVSNGVSFVGSIEGRYIEQVAREISRAAKSTRPAASIGLIGRASIGSGINEQGVIPVLERLAACVKSGKNMFLCQKAFAIEKVLNDGIINSGHHVLYKDLRSADGLPVEVVVKKVLHQSGIEGMALAGNIDKGLMSSWVETAILQKNATGGVGPIGSRQASFILGSRDGIGSVALIGAVTALITAALGGAAALLKALRSEKAYAMSEAKGFGTQAFSASQADWEAAGQTGSNNMLLFAGLAAGAYFLIDE